MTNDDILYRPAHARKAAEGVSSSAQELQERLSAFEKELTGDGDAFGADDLGTIIATIYGAIHQMAFESYGDNTGEMGTYAGNLQVMSVNEQRAEDLATVEVNRIREMLG
ncbi:hypothetical protein [Nonomuraea sp. NPDC050783]|uniref:hypothetical protein n=1 Tax=Nonomuraea sp. NPDC050783 TaxID=3154634 RepID=UPI003465AFAF